MAEIHTDWGELYPYSDHKIGDHIYYRAEGKIERGQIIWVAIGGTLPSGKHMSPHYMVAHAEGGIPDCVFFSDVVM